MEKYSLCKTNCRLYVFHKAKPHLSSVLYPIEIGTVLFILDFINIKNSFCYVKCLSGKGIIYIYYSDAKVKFPLKTGRFEKLS